MTRPTADDSIEAILSAIKGRLENAVESRQLTATGLHRAAARVEEISLDVLKTTHWFCDPDHPKDPGVARTLRRTIGDPGISVHE